MKDLTKGGGHLWAWRSLGSGDSSSRHLFWKEGGREDVTAGQGGRLFLLVSHVRNIKVNTRIVQFICFIFPFLFFFYFELFQAKFSQSSLCFLMFFFYCDILFLCP